MKFRYIALTIALLAISCSTIDDEIDSTPFREITSIEADIDDSATRTTIEQDGEGFQTLWSDADCIAVTDLTSSSTFRLTDGSGTTHGSFGGSIVSKSSKLYGVYPASSAVISGSDITVSIPETQSYTANKDVSVSGKNLMVGITENARQFTFNPVAAIARFSIKLGSTEAISSVTMRCENEFISGKGTLDPLSMGLGTLDSKSATLSYADPVSGENAEGWMLVAPVDFSTGNGKVYYDVVTDKGTYTFCHRPSKAFKKGMTYTFPLHVSEFSKVMVTSGLTEGKYIFQSNSTALTVRQIRATDTTITIAWSKTGFPVNYSTDIADKYSLYLLDTDGNIVSAWSPDQNLSQCVGSTAVFTYTASSPTYPPRWCFTGLDPDTQYDIYVKDVTTGATSNTLHTATIPVDCGQVVSMATKEGDVILFQNFPKEVWGGDPVGLAAGYLSADYATSTDIDASTAKGDWTSTTQTKFNYCNRAKEVPVFTTGTGVIPSTGLDGWGYWRNSLDDATSSSSIGVYMRTGCLKIGLKKVRAGVVTPQLKALAGNATLKVSFKASPYGASAPTDDLSMAVAALDGCTESSYRVSGTKVSNAELTLKNAMEWNEYSVELKGVTPTSRLLFYGSAASVASLNNRFIIDDIKVELVKYEGSVDTTIPQVSQVESDTTSATVEWISSETGSFTVEVFSDINCSKSLGSFKTTTSTDQSYICWPSRFTVTYLSPNSRYYVIVTSAGGKKSKPTLITTLESASSPSKILWSNSFNQIYWGGDYIRKANSINITGISTYTYSPSTLAETLKYCTPTTSPTVDGPNVAALSSTLFQLCGLTGWSTYNTFCRPGYLKVGSVMLGGWVKSPVIDGLDTDNSTVDISFDACPYVTDSTMEQNPEVTVSILGSDGNVVSSQNVTIGSIRNEPGWGSYSVSFNNVSNGQSVKIASAGTQASMFCVDNIVITSDKAISENVVHGYVTYSDGSPASGVVMSDGFQTVATDENGYYRMSCTKDVWYIYYSLPADCEVQYDSYGQPCFFKRYTYGEHRFNFTLKKMSSGKESSFTLICLADPQCKSTSNISRFTSETVPALKNNIAKKSTKCYGVTLGDIVFSSGSRDTNALMPNMRVACSYSTTGFPIFQTMGNHDYTYYYGTDNPNFSDETSSTPNLRAQRAFETVFGPVNFSWNRSDTHIVCMRDIVYTSLTSGSEYYGGFTKEQYEWLKSDLSHVEKDKMVIVCVHIPLVTALSNSYVTSVINLIKSYTNPQIMAGHTHYMRNSINVNNTTVMERTHAAVCGAWWHSNLNGDGCPNGYGVYDITGNTITDHCYMGSNTSMNDRGYQIRLYRGNQLSGGSYEYFKTQYGESVLLANVFNTNANWTIKVYEDGVYSGTMTLIPYKKYNDTTLPYVSTVSPTVVPVNSSQDWWTIGYHVGVLGIGHSSGTRENYMTACYHMYKYTLKNASATVKVVATDEHGNEYTQTEVMPATSTTNYYPTYIKSGNH